MSLITGERNRIRLNPMTESLVRNGHLKDFEMEDETQEEKRHSRDDVHNNKNTEQDESTCDSTKIKLKKESKQSKIKDKKATELEKDNNAKDQNANMESNDDFESMHL